MTCDGDSSYSQEFDPRRIHAFLQTLGGSGFSPEARDQSIQQMREIGVDRIFPSLSEFLRDPDSETRCNAAEAIMRIDSQRGLGLILPLLHDASNTVRWYVCGVLHDYGDERAIDQLIERMKTDPDPQIRGMAASALGGIGSPRAISALEDIAARDHAIDELGYSPSFCAERAIEEILNELVEM